MKTKKTLSLTLAAAMTAGLLVGCGGGAASSSSTAAASSEATASSEAASSAAATSTAATTNITMSAVLHRTSWKRK